MCKTEIIKHSRCTIYSYVWPKASERNGSESEGARAAHAALNEDTEKSKQNTPRHPNILELV